MSAWCAALSAGEAAVDDVVAARYPRGGIGEEEGGEVRDFLGATVAAQRVFLPIGVHDFFIVHAVNERRFHHAGQNAVGADAARAQLQRKHFHVPDEPGLARRIGGLPRLTRNGGYGGDKEQRGVVVDALFLQQGCLQRHRCKEVDSQNRLYIAAFDKGGRRELICAGNMHDAVQNRNLRHHRGDAFIRGNIGSDGRMRTVCHLHHGFRKAFLVTPRRNHRCSQLRTFNGDCPPDAGGGSRYEDGFPFEGHRVVGHGRKGGFGMVRFPAGRG